MDWWSGRKKSGRQARPKDGSSTARSNLSIQEETDYTSERDPLIDIAPECHCPVVSPYSVLESLNCARCGNHVKRSTNGFVDLLARNNNNKGSFVEHSGPVVFHFFTLRFYSRLLEEAYCVYSAHNGIMPFRIAVALLLIIYAIFGAFINPLHHHVLIVRFAMVVPAFAIAFLLSFARFFRRYMQDIATALALISVAACVVVAAEHGFDYFPEVMLTIVCVCSLLRLMFHRALVVVCVGVLAYEIVAAVHAQKSFLSDAGQSRYLLAVALVQLYFLHLCEGFSRRDFVKLLSETDQRRNLPDSLLRNLARAALPSYTSHSPRSTPMSARPDDTNDGASVTSDDTITTAQTVNTTSGYTTGYTTTGYTTGYTAGYTSAATNDAADASNTKGAVSAAACALLAGDGLAGGAVGVTAQFTVTLPQAVVKQAHSSPVLTVDVRAPSGALVPTLIPPPSKGVFSVSYVATELGEHVIAIRVCGEHVEGSPCLAFFHAGGVCARKCVASGDGLTGGHAGRPAYFTIQAHDEKGNPVTQGGAQFTVRVTTMNGAAQESRALDAGGGQYVATYMVPLQGRYSIAVFTGVYGDADCCPIADSPFLAEVIDPSDPPKKRKQSLRAEDAAPLPAPSPPELPQRLSSSVTTTTTVTTTAPAEVKAEVRPTTHEIVVPPPQPALSTGVSSAALLAAKDRELEKCRRQKEELQHTAKSLTAEAGEVRARLEQMRYQYATSQDEVAKLKRKIQTMQSDHENEISGALRDAAIAREHGDAQTAEAARSVASARRQLQEVEQAAARAAEKAAGQLARVEAELTAEVLSRKQQLVDFDSQLRDMHAENKGLKQQVDSLTQQLKHRNADEEVLAQRFKEVLAEIDVLHKERAASARAAEEREHELTRSSDEIRRLNSTLDSLRHQIASDEQRHSLVADRLRSDNDAVREENQLLRHENTKLGDRLSEAADRQEQLRAEAGLAQTQLKTLEAESRRAAAELEMLHKAQAQLTADLDSARSRAADRDILHTEVVSLRGEGGRLSQQVMSLEKELALERQIRRDSEAALTHQADAQRRRADNFEKDAAQAQEMLQSLRQTLGTLQEGANSSKALASGNALLKAKLNNLQKELEQSQALLERSTDEVAELRGQAKANEDDIAALHADRAGLVADNVKLNETIHTLESELIDIREQRRLTLQSLADTDTKLATAEDAVRTLTSQLRQEQQRHQQQAQEYADEVQECRDREHALRSEIENMRASHVSMAVEAADAAAAEKARFEEELDLLMLQLRTAESQIDDLMPLAAELEEAKKFQEELERTIRDVEAQCDQHRAAQRQATQLADQLRLDMKEREDNFFKEQTDMMAELADTRTKLTAALAELTALRDAADGKVSSLVKEMAELSQNFVHSEAAIRDLRSTIERLELQNGQLEEALDVQAGDLVASQKHSALLTAERDSLAHENERLKSQQSVIDQLQEEKDELRLQLADVQEENATVDKQLRRAEAEVVELKAALEQKDKQKSAIEKECTILDDIKTQLQEEIAELHADNQILADKAEETAKQHETEVKQLHAKIRELQGCHEENQTLRAEKQSLQQQEAEVREALEQCQRDLRDVDKERTLLDTLKTELQAEIGDLTAENETLVQQIETEAQRHQDEVAQLLEQLRSGQVVSEENAALQNDKLALQQQVRQLETQGTHLENEVKRLREQVAAGKDALSVANDANEAAIKELNENIVSLENRLAQRDAVLLEKKAEIQVLNDQVDTLSAKAGQQAEELSQTQKDLADLKQQLRLAKTAGKLQNSAVTAVFQSKEEGLLADLEAVKAQLAQKTAALDDATQRATDVSADLARAIQDLSALRAKQNDARSEVEETKRQLFETDEELTDAKRRNEQAAQELEALQAAMAEKDKLIADFERREALERQAKEMTPVLGMEIGKDGVRPRVSVGGATQPLKGAHVLSVAKGSPAEKAGILAGSFIHKVGHFECNNSVDFQHCVERCTPGDFVDVVVSEEQDDHKHKKIIRVEVGARGYKMEDMRDILGKTLAGKPQPMLVPRTASPSVRSPGSRVIVPPPGSPQPASASPSSSNRTSPRHSPAPSSGLPPLRVRQSPTPTSARSGTPTTGRTTPTGGRTPTGPRSNTPTARGRGARTPPSRTSPSASPLASANSSPSVSRQTSHEKL